MEEQNIFEIRSGLSLQSIATTTDTDLMSNNRMIWLDILKGIGMLIVIGGHSLITNTYLNTMVWAVHMPLFFICAGITFKFYPRVVALKKNLKRLIIPYGFGCLVVFFWYTCVNICCELAGGGYVYCTRLGMDRKKNG